MLIFILVFAGMVEYVYPQVTIYPEVQRRTDESVQIIKVEVTEVFTIVDLLYIARKEDAWICAEKNFYIQPVNSSERKYLIMAKEIPLCPDRKKILVGDEEFEFQLYFPAIDTSIMQINVVEKPAKGFNFFGVWLDANTERPEPDSLLMTSRDDFNTWFENRSEPLQPLEGIWDLTIVQSKMQGEVFLEYLDEEPEEREVALIWEDDHYACYDMEGKSLEISFSIIAEGGRFAYKEYFREIKEEVTTFIFSEDPDNLEFQFNVPKRWARYELSGRIFDNQELVKKMTWKKIFPKINK